MEAYNKLVQFAKDSDSINPNLLNDVLRGWITPCPIMDKAMEVFYNEK